MAKPTPGREYTVVVGDTLWDIATAAYGNGADWRRIWETNQFRLRSSDPDKIYPGEVILVPGPAPLDLGDDGPAPDPDLPGKESDDFTLVIDGEELPVESGRVFRAADTAASGFSASVAWDPEGPLTALLRPFGYQSAEVYLGGFRVLTGTLYTVDNSFGSNGHSKELSGWSKTADVIDSTLKPPYESNRVTLKARAEQLCGPLSIAVVYDLEGDEIFDRVKASPTDTIFSHLAKLAAQRGILVTTSRLGELVFTRAALGGSVGSLVEGVPPFVSLTARFDGRARFNVYKAIGQSPKDPSKSAVARDNVVPKSRFLTFSADDATVGNIQNAADWRRSKQLATTLSIPLPVTSWYAPDGSLWAPNTLLTVESVTLGAPDGFDFLVKSVNSTFDGSGMKSTLQLVPPQAYTGEPLVEPWLVLP